MAHVREQILTAVTANVTGLPTTGQNVIRAKIFPQKASSLPALLVYQGEDDPIADEDNQLYDFIDSLLTINIQAWAQGGYENFIISTADFIQSELIAAQDNSPTGIAFIPDGKKMFMVGTGSGSVHEYSLPTPFSLTVVNFIQSELLTDQGSSIQGITFSPDGTKMFMVETTNGSVHEYSLPTPFSLTTVNFIQSKLLTDQDNSPADITFSPDGTKMFMAGAQNKRVYEYDLASPFSLTTVDFVQSTLVLDQENSTQGIAFSPDGTKMFMIGPVSDSVHEYSLPTPFSLTTVNFIQSKLLTDQDNSPTGIAFSPDGKKMFMVGLQNDRIYEYDLSLLEENLDTIMNLISTEVIVALEADRTQGVTNVIDMMEGVTAEPELSDDGSKRTGFMNMSFIFNYRRQRTNPEL